MIKKMFSQEIEGQGKDNTAFPTTMAFDEADPFSVCFFFTDHDEGWIFSRDLLVEALEEGKAGQGDIRLSVTGGILSLLLGAISANGGGSVVHYPAAQVAAFINQAEMIVPRGTESGAYADVLADKAIAGWLDAV